MLEELITKDDLKQQTDFYDSEITRITEKISDNQNIEAKQQQQIDGIHEAIKRIRGVSDCDVDNTSVYGEMVSKIIVPEYQQLDIYLNGIPFGFHLTYTVKKAPRIGIYDIVIDSCVIIS